MLRAAAQMLVGLVAVVGPPGNVGMTGTTMLDSIARLKRDQGASATMPSWNFIAMNRSLNKPPNRPPVTFVPNWPAREACSPT